MKPIKSIAVATWLLEHLAPKPYRDSLSGDLMEEFRGGRSVGWYWRQVFYGVASGLKRKAAAYALALTFSACWSALYPAWIVIGKSGLEHDLWVRCGALDWPYSTTAQLLIKVTPTISFVWFGLLVYLMLHMKVTFSKLWILVSLSVSFNVLLIATILMHAYTGDNLFTPPYFYSRPDLLLRLALAMSLFSGIVCALRHARRRISALAS